MTIRAMALDDLQTVLDWAADEGWNPGLDDAEAFLAADPSGFLLKEIGGKPVAAISVVNHDPDFAFLGLYLCKPKYRGQGHGMDIWRAGIAHAGTRCIGLDGVPDQQANYARSGFVKSGSTVRYEGRIAARPNHDIREATAAELQTLVCRDVKATGIHRESFATAWLSQTPNRRTTVLVRGDEIEGFATFRRCDLGTKVGPLHASSENDALALLSSNPFASSHDPEFVDVQNHDAPLAVLLKSLGFQSVFETARMFTGRPPAREDSLFQAIATMELG